MSKWETAGIHILENGKLCDTPEQAARIVSLLQQGEAALSACMVVKDYLDRLEDLQEDDPLLAMRRHFHGPLHRAIDAAIAAAPASKL